MERGKKGSIGEEGKKRLNIDSTAMEDPTEQVEETNRKLKQNKWELMDVMDMMDCHDSV